MVPLPRCTAAPPSCSLVRSSPVPPRTTGGPAVNSCPMPVTITARCDMTRRAAPRPDRRPEAGRDHGDQGQVVDHGVPGRVDRHVGVAGLERHLHAAAAAGAVEQPDHRQPHLARVLLGEDLLGVDGGVAGAAAHGEVVGAQQHRAPVDPGGAGDEVGGQHRGQPALVVVAGEPGQRADLGEAAGVGQGLDALADGEPAGGPLAGDLVRAAHGGGQVAPATDLLTAIITASILECSCNFSRMLRTWFFTVFSLMNSSLAISRLFIPVATSLSTSSSRSVSRARAPAAAHRCAGSST